MLYFQKIQKSILILNRGFLPYKIKFKVKLLFKHNVLFFYRLNTMSLTNKYFIPYYVKIHFIYIRNSKHTFSWIDIYPFNLNTVIIIILYFWLIIIIGYILIIKFTCIHVFIHTNCMYDETTCLSIHELFTLIIKLNTPIFLNLVGYRQIK